MKSFQVGDKVRIKVKDSYKFWEHGAEEPKEPKVVAQQGKICTVYSTQLTDEPPSVYLNETGYMSLDDIELVTDENKLFTLERYVNLLDKDHPVRKEYEELMECKFRLEGLDK